jgi:hypothetical protein
MRSTSPEFPRTRRIWALAFLLPLTLAGCTGAPAQIRYAGKLTGCGPETPATLVATPDHFVFAPSDGVVIITGSVAPDRTLAGSFTPGAPAGESKDQGKTQSTRRAPMVISIEGKLDDEAFHGTYATPTCRVPVALTRVHTSIL